MRTTSKALVVLEVLCLLTSFIWFAASEQEEVPKRATPTPTKKQNTLAPRYTELKTRNAMVCSVALANGRDQKRAGRRMSSTVTSATTATTATAQHNVWPSSFNEHTTPTSTGQHNTTANTTREDLARLLQTNLRLCRKLLPGLTVLCTAGRYQSQKPRGNMTTGSSSQQRVAGSTALAQISNNR